jgi:hypothetical protein
MRQGIGAARAVCLEVTHNANGGALSSTFYVQTKTPDRTPGVGEKERTNGAVSGDCSLHGEVHAPSLCFLHYTLSHDMS